MPAQNPVAMDRDSWRIRVLVADDHAIVRQTLSALIDKELDMEVIGEAADGQQAIEQARLLQPDVVIMDVTMPRMNGLDATRAIRAEMPRVAVVGLSMHNRADMARAMRDAGAMAYLVKDGPVEAIVAAVRAGAGHAHVPHMFF
jgi:DNA-binding NarL/FixJ family response regulator